MEIRKLNEEDAQMSQELRLKALKTDPEAFGSTYEREVDFLLEQVASRIAPTKNRFVLGAFHNGELVGTVTFMRESGIKMYHKGNIFGMYVKPECRGMGIGKALLVELIEQSKRCEGLEQINLAVVTDNFSAKKLYESLGFEVYGTERNALKFEGNYYDEYLMVMKLTNDLVQY